MVAALRFNGLGGVEFAISVWPAAQSTCMQFASFPRRCSTSRTGHGYYLCRGEFLGFHHNMMQPSTAGKMLNTAHFSALRRAGGFIGPAGFFSNSEQK
jgi:hypothetical protein